MPISARNRRAEFDVLPQPSGWPALYKTVRDTDINKVDDCLDDIDTLLVFAGLYSAVLTAFVVESYTHLQQDPQDVIIGLLQQIATQNFTSGPGFINSTSTLRSSPPFEPELWAVRVNILWFTSLLLSLSSASFGILVKQWLREFLAIDYAAPRERLRARQYRSPGMADWKVFEIAAFLPLLLQLSLGLFFLGLCFFTAAVHASIGRTTTPLVGAWAFFFLMTTIAPLFSPRCPYKTTFLKRALTVGRCYVTPPLRSIPRAVMRILRSGSGVAAAGWKGCATSLRVTVVSNYVLMKWCLAILLVVLSPIVFLLIGVFGWWRILISCGSRLGPFVTRLRQPFGFWARSASEAAFLEEEYIIKTEEEDDGVLLSVDSLMSDDGLLPTMMDALRQQAKTSPEKIIQFVSQIIGRRTGTNLDMPCLTFVPDLRPLSKLAWCSVTDTLADILKGAPGPVGSGSPHWISRTIFILLSVSQFELSESATEALREIVASPWHPNELCSDRAHLGPCLARVGLDRQSNTMHTSYVTCLRRTMEVYRVLLCQDTSHSHPSLRHLLDAHMSEALFRASAEELLRRLFSTLISLLLGTTLLQEDLTEIHGSQEALYILLQYSQKLRMTRSVAELCRRMLVTESGTRTISLLSASVHPQCRVRMLLGDVYLPSSIQDDPQIQSQLAAVCERFCSGGDNEIPLDYVRLCAALVRCTHSTTDRAMALAIRKYYHTQGWRRASQRRDYWYSDVESPTPEVLFERDQQLACIVLEWWSIPTQLKDALWLFVPEGRREAIIRSIRAERPQYTPQPRTPSLMSPRSHVAGKASRDTDVDQDASEGDMVKQEASRGADVGKEQTEDHKANEADEHGHSEAHQESPSPIYWAH